MADEQDSEYDFAPREEPAAEPLPIEPAPEEPAAAAPSRLTPTQVCPHCGFEIFGKPRGGRCPECAAPLDLAGTDLLQFSDGAWVRRLSNGTLLFALAIVMEIGGVAVGWSGLWHSGDAVHILAAATGAWGLWLATTPEQGRRAERSALATPLRAASVAVVVLWMLLALVAFSHAAGAIRLFTAFVLLGYGVEAAMVGFFLQKVASRIPSDGLAAQALNLGWLMPGFCLVLVGLNAFGLAGPQAMILFFCAFPLIGGLLVMVIWTLSVLVRVGLELRNAASAGEAIAFKKAQRLAQKK